MNQNTATRPVVYTLRILAIGVAAIYRSVGAVVVQAGIAAMGIIRCIRPGLLHAIRQIVAFQQSAADPGLHATVVMIILGHGVVNVTPFQPARERQRNREHKNMFAIGVVVAVAAAGIAVDRVGIIPCQVP